MNHEASCWIFRSSFLSSENPQRPDPEYSEDLLNLLLVNTAKCSHCATKRKTSSVYLSVLLSKPASHLCSGSVNHKLHPFLCLWMQEAVPKLASTEGLQLVTLWAGRRPSWNDGPIQRSDTGSWHAPLCGDDYQTTWVLKGQEWHGCVTVLRLKIFILI